MVAQKEARYVNEWLAIKHPAAPQWKRQRLGPVATQEQARLLSVTLRWVDAIFIKDGIVHLVEAKLKPDAKAIIQLRMYDSLFPQTPQFMTWWNFPRRKILVTTREDPEVQKLAIQDGVIYEVFNPPFLKEVKP